MMLSAMHQMLILKMLLRHVYANDALISRRDVSELYKGRTSFFRAVTYLIESGLVERVEIKTNVVRYRLTLKGELLARIICGLVDMPEQFKDDAVLLKVLSKLRM